MKRYNIIYIVALLMFSVLVIMSLQLKSKSLFFYGFAENKETVINHIEDVLISKIHVTNGQEVKKGDLLIEVIDDNLPFKLDGLEIEKESVSDETVRKILEIQNSIEAIIIKKDAETTEIRADIISLEKEIELNKELFNGLKSINKNQAEYKSPDADKLAYLKQSLIDIETTKQQEIDLKKNLLNSLKRPTAIKSKRIDTEIHHFNKEKEKLSIYAPSDGLIGSISCKEGENISSFSKLMSFYKHNPTQVKGFVHESMILEVAVGDELEVSSTLHPEIKIVGEVVGLGSRIVEIPERLRKMADFKTYGREILIKIPKQNSFLQKEKVMLKITKSIEGSGLADLFSSNSDSRKKMNVDHKED